MTARVRAPELRGRGWLNTGGKDLTLADLRGKIVILDFWTYGCINCLHVLDELRPLEEKYGDALVLIGVHSPKFEHERDHQALAAAVERYGVHHPVIDDADMYLWQQYAAKAWPTLAVIDPTGYLVAGDKSKAISVSTGDCVKRDGNAAVKADCGDASAYTVVSIVDDHTKCEDPKQPYVQNPTSDGKTQILCLKPKS